MGKSVASYEVETTSTAHLTRSAYDRGQHILAGRAEEEKKEQGQFLTTPKVALYMARRIEPLPDQTKLLDPAIGSGVLPCAVIEQAIERGRPRQIKVVGFDTDEELCESAQAMLEEAKKRAAEAGIDVQVELSNSDFVLEHAPNSRPSLFGENGKKNLPSYDAIIANPPYFKLNRDDPQAQAVMGEVEGHTNIYTLFMGLAARLLEGGGHSSFIVPRSFCSGAYFRSFRESFLRRIIPEHVHVFVSREEAFDHDSVLQENIIFSFSKREGEEFDEVEMSTSQGVEDLSEKRNYSWEVPSSLFMGKGQTSIYYRLPSCELDERILAQVDSWEGSFERHGLEVSTGPVVPFRCRDVLTIREDVERGEALPLYWMQNVRPGSLEWPTDRTSKSQGILMVKEAESLLVPSSNYVLIRRFSSKEDRRRLTAAPFLASEYPYDRVGLENHVNYLYRERDPLTEDEARGISALLNCALVDRYFRILNGNTQVNATDLKSLNLPSMEVIREIGKKMGAAEDSDREHIVFDVLRENNSLDDLIPKFTETRFTMGKIQEAQNALEKLGMPAQQQNELAALTLLVLAQISEDDPWSSAEAASLGISEMIDEMGERYDRDYAENTRESVRKNVIHQFVQGAIAERNPDDPTLPTNSPNTHYALTDEVLQVLRQYGSDTWEEALTGFLENQRTLIERYKRKRDRERVPLTVNGEEYRLSPGEHNELQVAIIEDFGPQFAPGASLLYLGDTEDKKLILDEEGFERIGVPVPDHDKLPDVVLYDSTENWLYLIEAVTSRGPISPKRRTEIEDLMLDGADADPIYVSAFLDFSTFGEFMSELAWETEVWVASDPGHMIHFNGDQFMGPHSG
ncbi:BsuBI/PstI family type II restriction endonuclease [Salinibacter ruber]|uniref:BsuBI/PstI family type II restriction endonuclease n=1 Tax=Salinibacter ruber TaxID=146919 RepID=UPI002169AE60|nr:BsuBI/PstI family type II restriction endonuclease [Salinibacter ruber]MCS4054070.1 adenine-specific DNA-methyltransferase [Salinibacter ruber]